MASTQQQQSVSVREPRHEVWIDIARACAVLGVVLLHTLSGVPADTLYETDSGRLALWMLIRICLGRFAVPLFFMISGYLMLDPARQLTLEKLREHLVKLLKIFVLFGIPFAIAHTAATSDEMFIISIFVGVRNFIFGLEWNHLWFIWDLMCLYVLVPLFRPFVQRVAEQSDTQTTGVTNPGIDSDRAFRIILVALFVLSLVVPTFCDFFVIDYVRMAPFTSASAFYFLLGGYLHTKEPASCKHLIRLGFLGLLAYCVCALWAYVTYGYPSVSLENFSSPFAALWALAVFSGLRLRGENPHNNLIPQGIKVLSQDSLGIYIFHPLASGLLYRLIGINPARLPIGSALVFFLLFVSFGIAATELWRRIPRVGELL